MDAISSGNFKLKPASQREVAAGGDSSVSGAADAADAASSAALVPGSLASQIAKAMASRRKSISRHSHNEVDDDSDDEW